MDRAAGGNPLMGSKLPLTYADVAALALGAGWKGWQVVTATAVAKAESNHDGYAVGVVGAEMRTTPAGTEEANPAFRSLDVGLFQINTYWWPTVTVADMLDPTKNAAQAFNIWRGRFDAASGTWADRTHAAWSPWAVYKAGTFEQYLSAAAAAAKTVGAIS